MQMDLEMDKEKASQIYPMLGQLDLIEAVRHHVLRTSAAKHLRTLILRLEEACETARMAAISALQYPVTQSENDENTDHNFGFAELFAALRRARAELEAREFGNPKRVPPKSPRRDPLSASPLQASLSAAILAQLKAQR